MERKISEEEVSQTIDLSELLGREPSLEEKIEFADAFRNEVIDRTQSGKNINNRNFKGYTEDYADFKGSNQVDLTLFGDMLNAIDTDISGNNVSIKITDTEQATKAFAHITGYKGHPTIPNGKYKRDFFGLNRKDAERLAKQIARVTNDTSLIDILGTAPPPTTPQAINVRQILSTIGLLGD